MASNKCCNYHAGMLRHTITINKRTLQPDDEVGGGEDNWVAFSSSVRASVKPVSGREQLHAQQLKAPVTHEIVIRYQSGVTADMQAVFGTREFNIHSVLNVEERNRWMVLSAEENVNQ